MRKTFSIFYSVIISVMTMACGEYKSRVLKDKADAKANFAAAEFVPINSKDYTRYILVKNTSKEYLTKMTTEFGELQGTQGEFYIAKFEIFKTGYWHIIKIPKQLSFYAYHNLVAWYEGHKESEHLPDLSIGFAESLVDTSDSYLFYLNPNNLHGDTHIGAFNNGTKFNIYLPDAYEESGNIQVNNELPIDYSLINNFLTSNGFTPPPNNKMHFESFEVKIFE